MIGWVVHVLGMMTDVSFELAAVGDPAADVVHHSLAVGYSGSGLVERMLRGEAY